jgi:16S rRNA (uracil1498-N3)-methyltransferase
MSRRFFVKNPIGDVGSFVELADQEAHHLLNVMRAQPNDLVMLFDGEGAEFSARVAKLQKRAVSLEVLERREISRESKVHLAMGVALPKGDRQQWLCEKLVELGCCELTPLQTRRGVAEPGEAAITRLQRFVIEASKQCGRNHLMKITPPQNLDQFLQNTFPCRLFLDASGEPFNSTEMLKSSLNCAVAIGPEGGWSEPELESARVANWKIVSLGSRILRVETAAAAIAARMCLDEARDS